jgi:3-phosphoglycerate kinase
MQLADIFVNDAFADYRKSVSSYYIAKHLPSYVGTLFAQEVSKLAYLAHSPKPFVVLM